MKDIRIKWKGPLLSPSGYGTANRDYVQALYSAGIDITVESKQVDTKFFATFGKQGELVRKLKNKDIDYNIIVHHHVPTDTITKTEQNKFNIGYSTWETDKLPARWVENINKSFDLQLVPSEFNKEVYINSGVEIPIRVLPHCLDVQEFVDLDDKKFDLGKFNDKFKFLSVFQWTERKNPIGLLKAYYSTFYDRDDVVLIMKTYRSNTSNAEQQKIKNEITKLKYDMKLPQYPPIYFIGDLIERKTMITLYNTSDCFVLLTRAEGFGLPFAEACAGRCMCVAPNYGGHVDFLKPIENKSVFFTNYQMTPVAHMNWIPNYDSTQIWAEPDICDARFLMRHISCAMNQDQLKDRKQMARDHVEKTLNHKAIADKFCKIVKEFFNES